MIMAVINTKQDIKDAQRLLNNVSEGSEFVLRDGSKLGNIKDLYQSLKTMSEDVFKHHVRSDHNDFGNWVKDIFKDYQLANGLFSAKNKSECLTQLGTRIYELEKATASPGSVVLTPASAKLTKKKSSPSKRKTPSMDQAELEKTIQEINRRYWERKKIEEQTREKELAVTEKLKVEPSKTKSTPESKVIEDESTVEDLLELIEEESTRRGMLTDFKQIFSKKNVTDTATDIKKIFKSSKNTKLSEKEIIQTSKTAQNPDKNSILASIQKAHRIKR